MTCKKISYFTFTEAKSRCEELESMLSEEDRKLIYFSAYQCKIEKHWHIRKKINVRRYLELEEEVISMENKLENYRNQIYVLQKKLEAYESPNS